MPGWLRIAARTLLLMACLFALIRSLRIGWADALARSGDTAKITRAIAVEPRNEIWPAQLALRRLQDGESSPELRAELERCYQRRPSDSNLLMALGLLAEQNGNNSAAEDYLLHAAKLDHTFKPAWTLANFYFRIGSTQLMWPQLRRCLDLIEPRNPYGRSFDPTPVFALAWQAAEDPKAILAVLPPRREIILPYLAFLTTRPGTTKRNPILLGADAWPLALQLADPADRDILFGFLDQLAAESPAESAARFWNDLIDRGYLPAFGAAGKLNSAAGRLLADPDFNAPPFEHGFGWRVLFEPGINSSLTRHALSLEFTGGEKEHAIPVSTYAAVQPHKTYRLQWMYDGVPPKSLRAVLGDEDSGVVQTCRVDSCTFTVPEGVYVLPLRLRYDRPAGEMRLRGEYIIRSVRMEEVR